MRRSNRLGEALWSDQAVRLPLFDQAGLLQWSDQGVLLQLSDHRSRRYHQSQSQPKPKCLKSRDNREVLLEPEVLATFNDTE